MNVSQLNPNVQNMQMIPWEKIYDFVLSSGNVHDLKGFSKKVVHEASRLVPFDQARIYFLDGNGKVGDQYLIGIDKKWVTAYHEYYSKIEGGRYAIPKQLKEDMGPFARSYINYRSWVDAPRDEFVADYVDSIGLKYSLGFTLFDVRGTTRTCFMLDRTTSVLFSREEVRLLEIAFPQLNNLHKNFFSRSNMERETRSISWESTGLTQREIEIASLLCHGVKPTNISEKLHITQSTTYKHIAHIYEKMHVSSKQELLVKLLGD